MEGEQISRFPSEEEEDPPEITYTQVFREHFPYYLHLGMSYKEYWQMDCELVRAYRKAYEMKQEYDNSLLWLQGLYVFKALEAQRPGWNFWAGRKAKPEKYLEKPIAITEAMQARYKAEETQKMAAALRERFHRHNKQLAEQGGDEDGRRSTDSDNRDQVQ